MRGDMPGQAVAMGMAIELTVRAPKGHLTRTLNQSAIRYRGSNCQNDDPLEQSQSGGRAYKTAPSQREIHRGDIPMGAHQ